MFFSSPPVFMPSHSTKIVGPGEGEQLSPHVVLHLASGVHQLGTRQTSSTSKNRFGKSRRLNLRWTNEKFLTALIVHKLCVLSTHPEVFNPFDLRNRPFLAHSVSCNHCTLKHTSCGFVLERTLWKTMA